MSYSNGVMCGAAAAHGCHTGGVLYRSSSFQEGYLHGLINARRAEEQSRKTPYHTPKISIASPDKKPPSMDNLSKIDKISFAILGGLGIAASIIGAGICCITKPICLIFPAVSLLFFTALFYEAVYSLKRESACQKECQV